MPEENKQPIRCFIALDLPREAINEIKRIQDLIKKKNLFTGKFTEPENLHLTLKFLGEISEEQVENIKKKLSKIKLESFYANLGEVGVFSKSFIKIIWIKLNGKAIWELQKKIDEALSDIFQPEERFMGHITIARVKYVSDKKELLEYLKNLKIKNIKFFVDKFFLKKSLLLPEGPIYSVVSEYSLK